MKKMQTLAWRTGLVGIAAVLLSTVMTVRLARLQLSHRPGEAVAAPLLNTRTYTYPVVAARGGIYDRYGRPLVTNSVSYNINLDYVMLGLGDRNGTLLKAALLCSSLGYEYTDTLPLLSTGPEFTDRWTGEAKSSRLTAFLKRVSWPEDISAEELDEKLRKRYGVGSDAPYGEARIVYGLRYDMEVDDFSALNPFTLVKDGGSDLVAALAENKADFAALRADPYYTRVYHTKYAAHILGRTGPIFAEEYESLREQGYKMSDIVGKEGAEKAFESYLRGKDGFEKYAVAEDGRFVEAHEAAAPEAGGNVMLTLDIALQQAAEEALERYILKAWEDAKTDPDKPQDVEGGTAVVTDVNTGEVLAMASYPTYDITTYGEKFNEMLKDPLNPMLNRALSGLYSPGSIFKMVTAAAGLETGEITPETTIEDTGRYTYYPNFPVNCWIYTNSHGMFTHGFENVSEAIRDSCNVFFYEVGRRVGIELLASYARAFGLGEYTGVELPGEKKGSVPAPEPGALASWPPGETLTAAIGQSKHLYTPLQLTNYIATLANGGTLYDVSILRAVASADFSALEEASQPFVRNKIEMEEKNYQAIIDGMRDVAENGTASAVFQNYPIKVAGKTGSVQVPPKTSNSVFAAFAPLDSPEIAVVVIVEHGGSGNAIAPIARDIFDAYFYGETALSPRQAEYVIAE